MILLFIKETNLGYLYLFYIFEKSHYFQVFDLLSTFK